MLASALRRKATQKVQKRAMSSGSVLSEQNQAVLINWATRPIHVNQVDPDPAFIRAIKKEKFATGLIISTAAYIGYAYSRPVKDSALFDRFGDLKLPIITPFLDWTIRRFGYTNVLYAHTDPFQGWTDEEKQSRMEFLEGRGFFNDYYQDQGDDWDKLRIMNAVTQEALLRRDHDAYFWPEDENCYIGQLREMIQDANPEFKTPKLEIPIGDGVAPIGTKADRLYSKVIIGYDTLFRTQEEREISQAAYNFNTTALPTDIAAYNKLFGV